MGVDFDASWAAVGPRILVLLAAAQLRAAVDAVAYVAQALLEQGLDPATSADVAPHAFVGQASDGRGLDGLLAQALVYAKFAIGQGFSLDQALAAGGRFLDLATLTQVADAGRASELVSTTASLAADGYVRLLAPPSCERCAILAGKRFRWDNDFRRHPRCDCRTVPTGKAATAPAGVVSPEGYFHSLSRAQQDAVFGADDARAIRDGASPISVVNSHRGTFTPSDGRAATPGKRPTPGVIYAQADGDRGRALALLHEAGYLT